MKKFSRKRSAASISSERSDNSNPIKDKKNTKNNISQLAGQTKISSFFTKKTNVFTTIKEAASSSGSNGANNSNDSTNNHSSVFRRRLSLGSKKPSNSDLDRTKPKLFLEIVEEEPPPDLSEVQSPSKSALIVQQIESHNVHDNLNLNEAIKDSNCHVQGCKNQDSPISPILIPPITSTPNRSQLIEDEKANTFKALLRRERPHSLLADGSNSSCSIEPEKRQKLSNSIEEIYQAEDVTKIHQSFTFVKKENYQEKDRNVKATDRLSVNWQNTNHVTNVSEFEFENSVIKEYETNDSEGCDKILNKTEFKKLNLQENLGINDEKAITEAFEDDSFNLTTTEVDLVDESKNKKNEANVIKEQIICDKPLSFTYGRHIVLAVEKNNLGETHLKVVEDMKKAGANGVVRGKENRTGIVKTVEQAKTRQVILRGSWAHSTYAKEGDIINILNVEDTATEKEIETQIIVDDSSRVLVVVNPDMLMTGTSIVSTIFCMRKAVLNERFKGLESTNRTMFIGTLLHELLQQCLKKKRHNLKQVKEQLDLCLVSPPVVQDMLTLKLTADAVRNEVDPFLCHILYFIEKYVLGNDVSVPEPAYTNLVSESRSSRPPPTPEVWSGRVNEVHDIEENIWSPRLGIKGKVDLTLHVKLHKKDKQGRTSKTLPLELKTGRPSGSAEHRGQVILYSMMMSERWPDPQSGLLLYLRNSSITEVQAGVHEMRGLIQLRNQLAHYLLSGQGKMDSGSLLQRNAEEHTLLATLPDPINLKRACEQCAHLNVCTVYQKLENKLPPNPKHAMNELVPQTTHHLTNDEIRFFADHSIMAQLETYEKSKFSRIKSLWCNTPQQRENMGNAIANLKLQPVHTQSLQEIMSGGGCMHIFTKDGPCEESIVPGGIFNTGEMVLVGTDRVIALAQGTVQSINEKQVTLILDRDLYNLQLVQRDNLFHIDHYEYSSGSSSNLVNLAKLLSNENPLATRLRRIVVNKGRDATFLKGLPKEVATSPQAKAILRPLNRVQQKAAFRVMMAEQFVLLEGMPGSGKTTVIVALIRLLLTLGKSVLLTSYTHSAVDNVLLKLIEKEKLQPELPTKFLRIGKQSRIHPQVLLHSAEATIGLSADQGGLQEKLDTLYQNVPFVATTCLGINHPAVTTRRKAFDYCILDEAGQCLLLAALGPLLYAQKFVLVGDPQQLPPLVQSPAGKDKGMDISLFSHLATKQENIIPLTMQYRMNEKIQALANHLTYEGRLECGSERVAQRTVGLKNRIADKIEPEWLTKFVDGNSAENSVLFLNTDTLDNAMETICDTGLYNPGEADIVEKICKLVENFNVYDQDQTSDGSTKEKCDKYKNNVSIGIIAPYRAQVMHLRDKLATTVVDLDLVVNTVDQFQGQDKDIIIYSCTRSTPRKLNKNDGGNGCGETKVRGDILCDKRRLNVAITRAKCKLILVGNIRALNSYEPFEKLITYLQRNNSVFQIHQNDLDYFE